MSILHRLLAIVFAPIRGVNILAFHASLEQCTPLFPAELRRTLIAIPNMLLIPRRQVTNRYLHGYGLSLRTRIHVIHTKVERFIPKSSNSDLLPGVVLVLFNKNFIFFIENGFSSATIFIHLFLNMPPSSAIAIDVNCKPVPSLTLTESRTKSASRETTLVRRKCAFVLFKWCAIHTQVLVASNCPEPLVQRGLS